MFDDGIEPGEIMLTRICHAIYDKAPEDIEPEKMDKIMQRSQFVIDEVGRKVRAMTNKEIQAFLKKKGIRCACKGDSDLGVLTPSEKNNISVVIELTVREFIFNMRVVHRVLFNGGNLLNFRTLKRGLSWAKGEVLEIFTNQRELTERVNKTRIPAKLRIFNEHQNKS